MHLRPLESALGSCAPLVGKFTYAREPLVDGGAVDGALHFQLPYGAGGASGVVGGCGWHLSVVIGCVWGALLLCGRYCALTRQNAVL